MKARTCPACGGVITGWEAFLAHIHEKHTQGTDEERLRQTHVILKRGTPPWTEPPAVVIPPVTADPRTAALWFLIEGDRTRARELIGTMGTTERRAYLAQLTELINMLWGEPG